MDYIRKAGIQDSSRLAEILIFTKRMNYREIFHNDKISFGEMQVYPLAQDYITNPEKLENIGAIRFYQRHGFSLTHERQIEEGTTEYIVKMER